MTPKPSLAPPPPPVLDPSNPEPLVQYWEKPVWDLCTLRRPALAPEQQERHRIFSLLLMKIVADNWNGNKDGPDGLYPWRPKQRLPNGTYAGDKNGTRYLGHNIAAIAVDSNGTVLDFDFNHNNIFDSSLEHAESRLVRRLFSLTQLYQLWGAKKKSDIAGQNYMSSLTQITVYASLESCAQCAGIMALGQVPELVFLQIDPSQARIAVILYNLTQGTLKAPVPIAAPMFDFPYWEQLNAAYKDFCLKVVDPKLNMPFHIDAQGKVDNGPSITSFLCTDNALDIYQNAGKEFDSLQLQFPAYVPQAGALSNHDAYKGARAFATYVDRDGLRGTPHLT